MSETNENVDRLPKYLNKYIVKQNYSDYTAVDHAVWRYIMRINIHKLSDIAHSSYIDGLKKTGISLEKIPNLIDMNRMLSKIGWGAVCVDGFIPPAAFMEFQAYKVLVIAADIRSIEHVGYTPAPDIVHEAAGHAPIISDHEYAEYLRLFGEIGSKAIRSKRDFDLYEAIRSLSIIKENPDATKQEIIDAEKKIEFIQNDMGEPSELTRIRNLHWWSVEYGLIGDIDAPQIYGAGLLSSISESSTCLSSDVRKIPYSLETADFSFDITTKQPQLFVTPNFTFLSTVLNEFADNMVLRKGGSKGVQMAIDSNALATCELSSGLQISGIFSDVYTTTDGRVAYIKTTGPTILCEREKILIGHSATTHKDGYGSPVGNLIGTSKALEDMRLKELDEMGIIIGKHNTLNFESGVKVTGVLRRVRKNKYGKILLLTFSECSVIYNNHYLFKPEWGIYDMGVGKRVISVFAGVADRNEYESDLFVSPTGTIQNNDGDVEYNKLYQKVMDIRESKKDFELLSDIFQKIKNKYPGDWLLSLEIYELCYQNLGTRHPLTSKVYNYLQSRASLSSDSNKLIHNGLNLIDNTV